MCSFSKFLPSTALALLMILALIPNAFAEEEYAKGLLSPTPEDMAWDNANISETINVELNDLGWERLDTEMKASSLPPISFFTAPPLAFMPSDDILAGATINTPLAVDNSALDAFPPIRNQGSLNSCVAFAIGYYQLTYELARENGINTKDDSDNTNKISPTFIYNQTNDGGNYGTYTSDVQNLLLQNGACSWDSFPYSDSTSTSNLRRWPTDSNTWREAISNRIAKTEAIYDVEKREGANKVKTLLANGNILGIAVWIDSWEYETVGDDTSTANDDAFVGESIAAWNNGNRESHAMTIVGYNDHIWVDINENGVVDKGERGAWKIANSWGSSWKNDGYCWYAYDAMGDVSLVEGVGEQSGRKHGWQGIKATWLLVKPQEDTPKVLAKITFNSADRGQIDIRLGTGNVVDVDDTFHWYPETFSGSMRAGNCALDGGDPAVDMTFYFDFTDLMPELGTPTRFFLTTVDEDNSSAPTLVKEFTLVDVAGGDILTSATDTPQSVDGETKKLWVDYTIPANGNTSPTITSIADQIVPKNESTDDVAFTIGDAQTTTTDLILTAVSSDQAIISDINILLSGTTATRAITVQSLFGKIGETTITLTVSDGSMQTETSFLLTITDNASPVASANVSPLSGIGPLEVSFASTSTDADGTISSYEWSFGLGEGIATGATQSHIYNTAGEYTATLTVTDNNKNIDTTQVLIEVYIPPVAIASITPVEGQIPLDVSMLSESTDFDGTIISTVWDFGAGQGGGSGSTQSHRYTTAGDYTVTLTVTDNDGATDTTQVSVIAKPTGTPVIHGLSILPIPAKINTDVSFNVSVDDNDTSTLSYEWTFGDGGSNNETSPTHQYVATGVYTVKVLVTDSDLLTASASAEVVIDTQKTFTTNTLYFEYIAIRRSASNEEKSTINLRGDVQFDDVDTFNEADTLVVEITSSTGTLTQTFNATKCLSGGRDVIWRSGASLAMLKLTNSTINIILQRQDLRDLGITSATPTGDIPLSIDVTVKGFTYTQNVEIHYVKSTYNSRAKSVELKDDRLHVSKITARKHRTQDAHSYLIEGRVETVSSIGAWNTIDIEIGGFTETLTPVRSARSLCVYSRKRRITKSGVNMFVLNKNTGKWLLTTYPIEDTTIGLAGDTHELNVALEFGLYEGSVSKKIRKKVNRWE